MGWSGPSWSSITDPISRGFKDNVNGLASGLGHVLGGSPANALGASAIGGTMMGMSPLTSLFLRPMFQKGQAVSLSNFGRNASFYGRYPKDYLSDVFNFRNTRDQTNRARQQNAEFQADNSGRQASQLASAMGLQGGAQAGAQSMAHNQTLSEWQQWQQQLNDAMNQASMGNMGSLASLAMTLSFL